MSHPDAPKREITPNAIHPLVNRQHEIELIASKMAIATQPGKPIPKPIVCFWGAHGIGKSWLLYEIRDRYKAPEPLDLGSPSVTLAVRLDVGSTRPHHPFWKKEGGLDKLALVRELWHQVQEQTKDVFALDERATDWQWAGAIVERMTKLVTSGITPLILIDSLDDLVDKDSAAYDWLEEQLLEKLAITDRVLLVLTSRSKPTFVQRWQMRRRSDICRLAAFAIEDASEQAQVTTLPDLAASLYQYGHGYPMATAFLRDAVQASGGILDDAVARPVLAYAVAEMLVGIESTCQRLAQLLSVLRRIELGPVHAVLRACQDPLGDADERALDDMILLLRDDSIVYWETAKKTYAYDQALRRVLVEDLRLQKPEVYHSAYQAAAAYYRGHLLHDLAYMPWELPELLFSVCMLARGEQERSVLLTAEIDALRPQFAQAAVQDDDLCLATWEALDADKELKQLLPIQLQHELQQWLQSATSA